jgi:transposase
VITPDYTTQHLFPPCVEDWIGPDHPARYIRQFVDELDLKALGFKSQEAREGRPAYSNSLLLKAWLFGYFVKIRGSRSLEVACKNQLPLIWLTGCHYPDHNTLWRFWHANHQQFHALFKESVKIAYKAGMIGLALQAVDGTKIQAMASRHTGWSKEWVEKLDKQIDETIKAAEENLHQEALDLESPGFSLPPELVNAQTLREKIQEAKAQMEQTQREHYHPHEPEARRMKCEGTNRYGYNGQVVVDDKHGVITAAEVTQQENDLGQLTPMLEKAKENVGAAAQENVADSGYASGTDLLKAHAEGYVVTTPILNEGKSQGEFHSNKFQYEASSGKVFCPRGTELVLEKERERRGQTVQVFRCQNQECPVRDLCTGDKRGRSIEIWEHRPLIEALKAKLETEHGKRVLKKRAQTVEWAFAQIKQHLGFRRWNFRGLAMAKAQWSFISLVANLRVLRKVAAT